MQILIPLVNSRYSVLTNFGYELFKALQRNGCNVSLYVENNGTESSILDDIEAIIINKKITHILSFNGALLDLMNDARVGGIVFVSWMVDYPAYHYPRLNSHFEKSYVICPNEDHQHFINEVTTSQYLGVLTPGSSSPKKDTAPIDGRMFDVAIAGSWMGEPEKFWLNIQDEFQRKIIQNVINHLVHDDELDTYIALKNEFARHRIEFKKNPSVFALLINQINGYLRKYSRLKMMSALAQSGLTCLVIGEGWEADFNFPNFHFHKSADYKDMPVLYSNAKIVVNLNSNAGACERAIQAIGSGCSIFSFNGKSMQQIANQGHEVQFVSSSLSVEKIAQNLKTYASKITTHHSSALRPAPVDDWHSTAEKLVNLIDCIH